MTGWIVRLGLRKCSSCKETKSLDQFVKHKNKPHGRAYLCLGCKARKVYMRTYHRLWKLRKYGLSLDTLQSLFVKQKGACAICRVPLTVPRIDHNHKTGKTRGLLCNNCNAGLGMFKDSRVLLQMAMAIIYLGGE